MIKKDYTIKKEIGHGFWLSPKGEVYGLNAHIYIRDEDPEFHEKWMETNTDTFMQWMMRKGWIRFRVYGYGVHINGCSLTKPHKRAQVKRVLMYALDHHKNECNEDTKVTLMNSNEGCYGARYVFDPQYTVGSLLGRLG